MHPASYNGTVRYADRLPLLTRGLFAALALLLSLGPFLHGHLGGSHVTGFHLDGVDAAAHASADPHGNLQAQPDQESPAIGVEASLSKSEKDSESSRAGLHLAVLPIGRQAPKVLARVIPSPAFAPPACAPLYAVGLPPPSLAPPSLHA